jgi:hypothetical protein
LIRKEVLKIPTDGDDRLRYLTYEQMNLINAFRSINVNYAVFSRFMFDCMVRESPCFEAAYSRLLLVPYETFQIFSNYYSEEDGTKIYNLMVQDIVFMKRLTEALIDRDEKDALEIMRRWEENIGLLSEQYASLNVYWTREQWQSLLLRNFHLVYQQILSVVADDCSLSFGIFDRVKSLATLIGDYQARGIIRGLTMSPESVDTPVAKTWLGDEII